MISSFCAMAVAHPWADAAEAVTEAEALIQRGLQLRRSGDDASALPLFERAYALNPNPRAAAQVGLAEQAVGRLAEAEMHVTTALQSVDDPWIRKHRSTIEQALATIKSGVCTLEPIVEPVGAAIRVNGRQQGTAPLPRPVRVTQGTVLLEVSAQGYAPTERRLSVRGGGYESVVIRLSPLNPVVSGSVDPGTQAMAQPARESGTSVRGRNSLRMIGWGAFVAAGVSLTFGTIEYLSYRSKVIDFNGRVDGAGQRRCFDDGTNVFGPDRSMPAADCSQLASEYRSAKRWSFIGFGVGAALAGAAIAITVVTSPGSESKVALRCGMGSEVASLVCGGTF